MAELRFVWDEAKASSNQTKHGVSFEEAETAFEDPLGRFMGDPDHSEREDRFVLLGMSSRPRLLVVVHCYREDDSTVRIISARRANRREASLYVRVQR